MKRFNMFSRLPQEDQTLVLNLCDKLPYHEAAKTLARPRSEGGLALTTSPASLCKFYTQHHPQAVALETLGQFSAAIQVHQQAHGEANFEALLGLVQNRLLAALREGKPLAALDRDFRNLQRVQKCFLADTKYRAGNERTQDAYLTHVKRMALHENEPEFIDHTLEKDPGAGSATIEDFQEPTQLEQDIDFAHILLPVEVTRQPTFLRSAARIIATRAAAERKRDFLVMYKVNPAFALPELDPANVTPASLLKLQQNLEAIYPRSHRSEISPQHPSQTPAISHISPNFAQPNSSEIQKTPSTPEPLPSRNQPPDPRLV